jgi:hypothetical protein
LKSSPLRFGNGPFGRLLGHENGALINGISALIRTDTKATRKAEIRRITIQGQFEQKVIEIPISTNKLGKCGGTHR